MDEGDTGRNMDGPGGGEGSGEEPESVEDADQDSRLYSSNRRHKVTW